jgi:hypothetical protein
MGARKAVVNPFHHGFFASFDLAIEQAGQKENKLIQNSLSP